MMDINSILISVAVQFPLLVLFVIYNERKDKSFQDFLREQRKENTEVLKVLIEKFDRHDDITQHAIARMEERTRPRPERNS